MLKVFTDMKNFDLGVEDFGLSGGKDIHVYVLDEKMSALSLMEAFRACRSNPLRTYFYIPDTESDFSKFARESISRGTVNVFSDLEELKAVLRSEVDAWRTYSIPDFIQKSAENFKIFTSRDMVNNLSVEVTSALRRNSCYTVALALLRLFQSGEPLLVPEFQASLAHILETRKKARMANDEFKQRESQFLSVLVAGNKKTDISQHTDEYNGIALHVMFQPLTPEDKHLDDRVRIITQLVKEEKQHH